MNFKSSGLVPRPSWAATLAGLFAVAGAVSLMSRVPGSELLALHQFLIPVLFCAAGLWFVMLLPARVLIAWARPLSVRSRLIAILATGTAGLIWIFALPVGTAPAGIADVSVTVLEQTSDRSLGNEVWLRLERDGQDVPLAELTRKGAWLDKSPFLVASDPVTPASVTWRGAYTENLRLIFISHAWSGRARVTWNGHERDLDLYSAEGTSEILDIGGLDVTNSRLAFPTRNARQWLTASCDAMLLGVMTVLVFGWLVVRLDAGPSSNGERPPTWREALAYSLPLVLTSAASLIMFYPGMMTSDSLDQWRQASQMSFNDAHPLLYGLLMVGMRLLWDSPAAVAGVQMLLFAAASGWLVATVRRAVEAPRTVAWASAWLIALFPLLPLTAITLWKDVPYATAVIALTAFVVARLQPGTTGRLSARATIALSLLMFCAMALRHNGPPVAFAAALVLFFVASHSRLRVIVATVAAVILMVLLKGPISDAAGIERKPVSYVLYSHHIAAHLASKHLPENPADRALLQQLNPKDSDWAYNCATVNPIVFNPNFDARNAMAHDKDLLRILLDLARTRPDIEFDHGLCSSGLIWRLRDSPLDPLYLSGVGLWAPQGEVKWITGKAGDPVQHSLSPALAQFVGKMVLLPGMEAAFRPALYMYLLIFACGVAVVRRHDRKLWLLLSLPAVHTAFLAISIVAQDARYQLPLYVITLGAVPLLIAARRSKATLFARQSQ